jgi:formylglycine-generating enzyme required for sulfatase activity
LKTLGAYPGLRLLTEWEWQWAATGRGQGFEYPWGATGDAAKANTSESGLARTTAVGVYPAGSATCGALDLSGNVWEWCLNEFNQPDNIGLSGQSARVVRGGAWFNVQVFARVACRGRDSPDFRYFNNGFRVGCRPPSL